MEAKLRAKEIQAFSKYKSADGSEGVTRLEAGIQFKNGLFVGGTFSAAALPITTNNITINGIGGNGYIQYAAQTVAPSLALVHTYVDSGGHFAIGRSGSSAFDISFTNGLMTANRDYAFQNKSGTLAMTSDNVSEFTNDAGYLVSASLGNYVQGPASAVAGRIASFDGTTGKLIQDSGVLASAIVLNTRSLTAGAGLTGGGDLSADRTFDVGAGSGITVNANDVALTTPGTLTVATSNASAGSHTHAITSSANPGAAAAILASDASGFLRLVRLGVGTSPTQPLEVAGNAFINAATANLYMKDTSTGLQVSATGVITPQSGNTFRNTAYTSGLVGWYISDPGNAEFNNVDIRGALHASVIVYGQVTATAGTILTSKSAAKLKTDVTIPSSPTYGTTTVNVDAVDADGLSHASSQLFVVNDILYLKDGLVGATWLKVSSVSDQTTFWRYVCTIQAGTNNVTYRAGLGVADYGGSGSGFIVQTADATNAPYMQMATHAATFTSANSSGTLIVTPRLRIGNLNGSYDYVTNVYGLAAGDYVGGSWIAADSNGLRVTGAGGKVSLDSTGLNFVSSAAAASTSSIQWRDGGTTVGSLYTLYSGGGSETNLRSDLKSANTTNIAFTNIIAANDQAEQAVLTLRSSGSAEPTDPNKSWASIYGTNTFLGLAIGVGIGTRPAHMLDVYGTGWFQDVAGQAIIVSKTQSANDLGSTIGFYGGAAGATLRGYVGFTHRGSGTDTIFTGEAADCMGIRSEVGIQLGIGASLKMSLNASGVGLGTASFGASAANVFAMANGTAPSTSPAGIGQLYVAAGALCYRGSSGTVTTIAVA